MSEFFNSPIQLRTCKAMRFHRFFAIAISLAVLLATYVDLPAASSTRFDTVAEIEAAFRDFDTTHSLKFLATGFGSVSFIELLESSKSAEENDRIWALIDRLVLLINAYPLSEESVACEAFVAHLFDVSGRPLQAEAKYKVCIAKFKQLEKLKRNTFRPDHIERRLYSYGLTRCQIALALLYCKQKKCDKAERIYTEIMLPYYLQSPLDLYRKSKDLYSNIDGSDGAAISALAATLGHAYDQAKHPFKARQKFNDLWEIKVRALHPRESKQAPSVSLTQGYSVLPIIFSSRPNYDAIIGDLPPLEEMMRWYLSFGVEHPLMCKQADLASAREKVEVLSRYRESDAARKRQFEWQAKESSIINRLEEQPQMALAELKALIDMRRSEGVAEPGFSDSLNSIGYQLTQLGMYNDAETFLLEAVAQREKAGIPALAALGQSCSNLASVYIEQGKFADVEPLIYKAIKLRAADSIDPYAVAKSKIVLGRLLAAQGRLVMAEAQLREAVEIFETPALKSAKLSLSNFGELYSFHAVDPIGTDRRILDFTTARVSDDFVRSSSVIYRIKALIELGGVYIAEQKYDLAQQVLEQAIELNHAPSEYLVAIYNYEKLEPRAYAKLGVLAAAAGNYEKAQEHLKKANSLAVEQHAAPPVYADIYTAYGDLDGRTGQKLESKMYYHKAAELLLSMLGANNPRVRHLRELAGSSQLRSEP